MSIFAAGVKSLKLKCRLCHKETYSKIGKDCKMCGMPLKDESRDFCSRACRHSFFKIKGIGFGNAKGIGFGAALSEKRQAL